MIIKKFSILFVIFAFSLVGTSSLIIKENKDNSAPHKFYLNIDSLSSSIKTNGWNESTLDEYSFFLNNSAIDFNHEEERIKKLPGRFENAYLQSLILKREQLFGEMFDSLFSVIHYSPAYLNFYDEIVFAANASGQLSLLENEIEAQKLSQQFSLYLTSLIHSAKGEYERALEALVKAEMPDSKNYKLKFQISQTYRHLGDYQKSFDVLEDALLNAGEDKHFTNKALIAEGTLNYFSGSYQKAEMLYKKALTSSRKSNDKQNEITALVNTAIIFDHKGDYEKSRDYFRQGLNEAVIINDIESEAFAFSELGVSYTFTNEIIEAKENYLKSYSLYKKINDRLRLSLLSENIGKIFVYLFDYQTALEFYEKGFEYAGDNKRAQVLNLVGMADVYANLSNYSKALRLYKEAQEISSQVNELSLTFQVNNGLGSLNFNLNRFNNAAGYFKETEELNKISDDIYTAADVYYKLGLTYLMLDSLDVAEKYLEQSISASVEAGDFYTEALAYANLASLKIELEEYRDALSSLMNAKTISLKNHLNYLSAECSLIEGEINKKQNNFNAAKNNFLGALKISKGLNEFNLQIEAYRQLAELFNEHNLNEAAESYYTSAINLIEDISRPLFEEEDVQISYFSGKSDIYNSLANFYLDQKRYKEAFEIIETSRSRSTVQNLVNIKLRNIIKDEKTISDLYDYEWMIHSGIYGEQQADSLQARFSMLKKALINKYPEAEKYLTSKQNLSLEAIQKSLDEKENILCIFSNDDKSFLFLVNKNRFIPFEANLSKQEIQKRLSEISPYYSTKDESNIFYNQDLFSFNTLASYNLYKDFFKQAFDAIPQNEKIIIAPSTELISMPFEALVTKFGKKDSPFSYRNKEYLLNNYTISYTPSASAFIHQKNNDLINEEKILIVGNPEINNRMNGFSDRRGLLEEGHGLPRSISLLPLKYSEEEVNEISGIIDADNIYLDRRATETNFKMNAELSRVIHLSTHSFLYNKQPVIFFSNFFDAENDGFLEPGEIVKLKLNSDLVVLSSCNSGLGRIDEAEGILGMTKAFYEAGTKSIVVSLWEVNDKYTSKLMGLFYKKMSDGYDKSEALRLAKIDFMKKYSANPYFWGAFVLSGDVSGLNVKTSSPSYIYAWVLSFIIIVSLLIIFLYHKRRNHRFTESKVIAENQ